jgi:hypothetical protein
MQVAFGAGMTHSFADYLFLTSLVAPTAGIVVGVLFLLVPRGVRRRAHTTEATAHG